MDYAFELELAAWRRTHFALTCVFVGLVVVTQLMYFARVFYAAMLLTSSIGFAYLLAGTYVGILISNLAHSDTFRLSVVEARVLVWTAVVSAIMAVADVVRLVALLVGSYAAHDPSAPIGTLATSSDVERMLATYLHSREWFAVVLVLGLVLVFIALDILTVVLYGRFWARNTSPPPQQAPAFRNDRATPSQAPPSPPTTSVIPPVVDQQRASAQYMSPIRSVAAPASPSSFGTTMARTTRQSAPRGRDTGASSSVVFARGGH